MPSPHYCWHCSDLPVGLSLHFSLTHEHTLHLWWLSSLWSIYLLKLLLCKNCPLRFFLSFLCKLQSMVGGVLLSVCGVSNKGSVKLPSPLSFSIQIDVSCLSFEGHQFQGKKAIMDKLNVSLSVNPAQKQCRQYFLSFFLYFMYMFAVMLGFCCASVNLHP